MSVSILLKRFNISQNTEPTRKGSKDTEFTLSFYIQSPILNFRPWELEWYQCSKLMYVKQR